MLPAGKPKRVDWFRVVVDLERKGYSHKAVALIAGRAKGWVQNLKDIPDTEPRHIDGEAVLALWSLATGKPRDSHPRVVETVRIQRPHDATLPAHRNPTMERACPEASPTRSEPPVCRKATRQQPTQLDLPMKW